MRIMPPPKTLSMGENTRYPSGGIIDLLLIHNANAEEMISLI